MSWIKVENATPNKPEVLRLARLLGVTRDDAFGKAMRFWLWLDSVTVDGRVDGVTSHDVDAVVGAVGVAMALQEVGWAVIDDEDQSVTIPNFARHNGESGKARALKTRRQAKWRNGRVDVSVDGAASTPASLEKRREEKIVSPNGDTNKSATPKFAKEDMEFAEWMLQTIREDMDPHAKANLPAWARSVRLMRERDGRELSHAREVFTWAHGDTFWRPNILCPDKLREKYTQLQAKMSSPNGRTTPPTKTPREYIQEALRKSRESEERDAE